MWGCEYIAVQNRNEDFFYRYRSPVDDSIKQYKIGNFPQVTLEARIELIRLKAERNQGFVQNIKRARKACNNRLTRACTKICLNSTVPNDRDVFD